MKMILAIINSGDASDLIQLLIHEKYSVTRIATSGGFLRKRNVTIMIGTEDEKVEKALKILKEHSKTRMEMAPVASFSSVGYSMMNTAPIPAGGAVVFVLDVAQYDRF